MVEGGTAHGYESHDQVLSRVVPPAPVYKGARGRPAGPWARQGGVLLLVGVGLPSFLLLLGGGKEGGEGEGKGGAACPRPSLSLSTRAHKAHYFSRGGPVTLRHSGFL